MNKITEYILKKMKERRPDDTIYALAKRTNIKGDTLYKTLKAPKAWVQPIHLMRICSDLGLTMEEVLTQNEKAHGAEKDVKHWRDKYFEELERANKLEQENQKLKNAIKELTK